MKKAYILLVTLMCIENIVTPNVYTTNTITPTEHVVVEETCDINIDSIIVSEPVNITANTPEEQITPIPTELNEFEDVPSTEEIPFYTVTAEEREMLARLVFLEASICSDECKRAVVSVVFNRLNSGRWKKDVNNDGKITLYDIVYYPEAFTPAYKIETTTATQSCYNAVDEIIFTGPSVPTQVRYFRTKYDFKWNNYKNYCVLDNVYFGYFSTWESGTW